MYTPRLGAQIAGAFSFKSVQLSFSRAQLFG